MQRQSPRIAASAAAQEEGGSNTVTVIEGTTRYPVEWRTDESVDAFKSRIAEATGNDAKKLQILTADKKQMKLGTQMKEYTSSNGALGSVWLKVMEREEDDDGNFDGGPALFEGQVVAVLVVVGVVLLLTPVTGAQLFGFGSQDETGRSDIGSRVLKASPEGKAITRALGYNTADTAE